LKRLSHKINLRVALLMVLALLGAQLGAQAHAYSHLSTASHAADSAAGHGTVCPDCLCFAPLLASAGGLSQAPWFAPQDPQDAPDSAVQSLIPTETIQAFRSRAPPPIQ
jgi:hypothetical protein